MKRCEIKTRPYEGGPVKSSVFCENTVGECQAYLRRMEAAGVIIEEYAIFDRQERVSAIRSGMVSAANHYDGAILTAARGA